MAEPLSVPITIRSDWLRAACWLAAIGFFVGFTLLAATGPGPHRGVADYAGTFAFGVVLSAAFLRGTRLRVEVDDAGLSVFNLWTTRHVAWHDVARVGADYYGLRILRTDGGVITAATLGKPNWATFLRRRSRADDVAEWLEGEAERRR